MKKGKHTALLVLLASLLLVAVITVTYRILQDENKLTLTEKNYITQARSNLINVNVLNDANIFGSAGEGVFYDFLSDFQEDRELKFNQIAINIDATVGGLTFAKGKAVPENAKVFYIDHYVLVGKNVIKISNSSKIDGTVGVLTRDAEFINTNLVSKGLILKAYDTREDLEKGLTADEITYMLVPMVEYLDTTLGNQYNILYHFGDLKDYYYMTISDNELLTSILKKYYNTWMKDKFEESFNSNEYKLFTNKLKITEKELDIINSKEYDYGFIKNAPYDVKAGIGYGGVMSIYLTKFAKFSGITINYKEYSNLEKLNKAIKKDSIDIHDDIYNVTSDFVKLDSEHTVDISFAMNNAYPQVFNTVETLKNETIYVKEGTFIEKYLKNNGFKVEVYKRDRDAKGILNKGNIVAMDLLNFDLYHIDNENVSERFRVSTTNTYSFATNADTMFNRLLTYYINTLDRDEVISSGMDNYYTTIKSGRIITKIVKYAAVLVVGIASTAYLFFKFGKRIHIKKKIKKADKIKYIDMLTSLKNRNFLKESLPTWNQNTIYPQAIIIMDLNGLQDLNDTYGYAEGDKQIQAVANILIKTQLDNTEIMRTDGNEFTIYMIGYNEKQVLSYIKKLNKEMKSLPHEGGAAIGFAMIDDDVKLIDDAINEATEIMLKNKELMQGEIEDEKI